MNTTNIYSSEQIQIPPDLSKVLRDYAKAVIKIYPDDINKFCK